MILGGERNRKRREEAHRRRKRETKMERILEHEEILKFSKLI
jgi:hypothetical protein